VQALRNDAKLIVRDLATIRCAFGAERFGAFIAKPASRTAKQDAFFAYSDELINELKQAM